MSKLHSILHATSMTISKLLVTILLIAIYMIVIIPYSMFIGFNRTITTRNHIYDKESLKRMW